jgi:hypothetical protein
MKKVTFAVLIAVVAFSTLAMAQNYSSPTDVLGAHLVYGRGCVACHAPHSGAAGNGVNNPNTGNFALWGQDLAPYLGQTFKFGDFGKYAVTMPTTYTNPFDAVTGIMLCLSCHDGNLAKVGMMKGKTVESIPGVGGAFPTLLGNDGSLTAGNYLNDHPVGPVATVGCGGPYDWDCTDNGNGTITLNGPNSSKFLLNYGFTAETFNNGAGKAMVTCISCHDQHSQNVYKGTINNVAGYYKTMFFVRGYYDPSNTASNSAAQFCRQCHGGEGNESHNSFNIPTV